MSAVLPKPCLAERRASLADRPFARCSSSSSSRSDCNSRSRSASSFRICHHFISTLLSGRPHDARHGFGHLLPFRLFDQKLFSTLLRQSVIFELSVFIRRSLPFGRHPSSFFKTM